MWVFGLWLSRMGRVEGDGIPTIIIFRLALNSR